MPAHEKVKLNPDDVALEGKPLGTLFPFINNKDLQRMPITNLEFTYCEESQGTFIKPGLRLEADVMLKDSLEWASDALKSMCRGQKTPESIHLSAHLSDERDWTKRPVVEKFVLQGYFQEMALETWDMLKFKTMGIEITGTKAVKGKPRGDEEDSHTTSDDPNKEKSKDSTKPEAEPGDEPEKPSRENKKDENGGSENESKKPKEPQSWNFGFGFYGTVMLTNVPHANVPLELNYRIARDFEVDGKDEGGGDDPAGNKTSKDDEAKNKPEDNKVEHVSEENAGEKNEKSPEANLTKPDDEGKHGSKSTLTKPKKEYSDGAHKKIWNVVIWCDKWENIYGIKNVSVSIQGALEFRINAKLLRAVD